MGEWGFVADQLAGLVFMGTAAFVVVQAVLEWRAGRHARRLGTSDADAIHARLDALGRQMDALGRQLPVPPPVPPPAENQPPPGLPLELPAAPRPRHPTPV